MASHSKTPREGSPSRRANRNRRRPTGAERRAAINRAQRRRRILTYVLPTMIVALIAGVAVLTTLGKGKSGTAVGDRPSAATDVSVDGPPLGGPLGVGQAVPGFSAPGLEGRVSWSDFAGKPTVLVVWAAWCPHCQAELPIINRIATDFPTVGIVSVATAIGQAPGPTPRGLALQDGLTFPVAIDDAWSTVGKALGANAFPTVYLVDHGRVRQVVQSEQTEQQLRALFQQLAGGA